MGLKSTRPLFAEYPSYSSVFVHLTTVLVTLFWSELVIYILIIVNKISFTRVVHQTVYFTKFSTNASSVQKSTHELKFLEKIVKGDLFSSSTAGSITKQDVRLQHSSRAQEQLIEHLSRHPATPSLTN